MEQGSGRPGPSPGSEEKTGQQSRTVTSYRAPTQRSFPSPVDASRPLELPGSPWDPAFTSSAPGALKPPAPPSSKVPQHSAPTSVLALNPSLHSFGNTSLYPSKKTFLSKIIFLVSSPGNRFLNLTICPLFFVGAHNMAFQFPVRKVKVLVAQSRPTLYNQAPLSMGFSKKEYWSGLPCPSLGNVPRDQPQISCIAGGFFTV